MPKTSINLLIETRESIKIIRLRKYFPLVATTMLILFVSLYLISLVFIQINKRITVNLTQSATTLEQKINESIKLESIYTQSAYLLKSIEKLTFTNKNIVSDLIPIIYNLQTANILISSISSDNAGKVTFSLTADTVSALDLFIDSLIQQELQSNIFSTMKAQNIVRTADGKYALAISLTVISN